MTNLEVTSGVHKDIRRLKVAVDDSRRVHIVQTAQDLVEEELQMRFLQVLTRVDDVMQVLPKAPKTKQIHARKHTHTYKKRR